MLLRGGGGDEEYEEGRKKEGDEVKKQIKKKSVRRGGEGGHQSERGEQREARRQARRGESSAGNKRTGGKEVEKKVKEEAKRARGERTRASSERGSERRASGLPALHVAMESMQCRSSASLFSRLFPLFPSSIRDITSLLFHSRSDGTKKRGHSIVGRGIFLFRFATAAMDHRKKNSPTEKNKKLTFWARQQPSSDAHISSRGQCR